MGRAYVQVGKEEWRPESAVVRWTETRCRRLRRLRSATRCWRRARRRRRAASTSAWLWRRSAPWTGCRCGVRGAASSRGGREGRLRRTAHHHTQTSLYSREELDPFTVESKQCHQGSGRVRPCPPHGPLSEGSAVRRAPWYRHTLPVAGRRTALRDPKREPPLTLYSLRPSTDGLSGCAVCIDLAFGLLRLSRLP